MAIIYRGRCGSHRATLPKLPVSQMTDRQVWVTAGRILATHAEMTATYVRDDLGDTIGPKIGFENLRRIARAVDAIVMVGPHMPRC
jgi:hypothetical protein